MDQEKIGKLIAKLRKSKGLTQAELGDKVGVGYRAVSKWERGLTLPDISIINKLSEILGISSDELLKGELNHKPHQKINYKPIIYILSLILIIIAIPLIIIKINKNKVSIYDLESDSKDYYIEGKITFKNNTLSIYINKIDFYDLNFLETTIQNYQYSILSNDKVIVAYGYMTTIKALEEKIIIGEFKNKFTINYTGDIPTSQSEIVKNKLHLKITFIDEDENEITKDILISIINNK